VTDSGTSPAAGGPASTAAGPRRALLVGSSGGHLAQLIALEPWWRQRDRLWVTFRTPDAVSQLAHEATVWAFHPTTRNVINLVRNLWLAIRTVPRYRPDVIVSTGAGVALPFFVLGRLWRIPTVYVEVYDRIDLRTLTARLCRPFTSLLCVQWEEQRALYPEATLIGSLL
jgi:UDP-N-acetylglucosamine:LPS N-acetylglucosamine transferase